MHSFVATASQLFVNPTAHNYHLLAGSPAIDQGTSTDAPYTDFDGTACPSGLGVDIGACAFVIG